MKKVKRRKVWLLDSCVRNSNNYITVNGRNKVVSPNQYLHKVKDIVLLTTGNGSEKNYFTVLLNDKSQKYYFGSMLDFVIEYGTKKFTQVNKTTVVNLTYCTKTLSDKYLFIDEWDTPIKVGECYRESVRMLMGF